MSPASRHPLRARFVWLRRRCLGVLHWHGRALIWLAAAAMLIWGGSMAWLQWWFFPHLESYRPRLVAELAKRAGRPVEIGQVSGGWRLGQPYLDFHDLALRHKDGRPALSLRRAEATLSWWPLLIGDVRFESLAAIAPDLEITRDASGSVRLADLPLDGGDASSDNGFGNWLLRQHAIRIVDGRITWRDAMRNAPPLVLDHVSFTLENRLFGHHAFSLAAMPPAVLALSFSLDGDWTGDDVDHFAQWNGSVETKLADVDLAAWSAWLPYPIELKRGRGRLALSLSFHGLQPVAADAGLDIHGAVLRLAPELDPLSLQTLAGTLKWRDEQGERHLDLSHLRLTADGGKLLDGSNASLSLGRNGGGKLEADVLTLPALANLPPALPLPNAARKWLAGMRPSGRLDHVEAEWTGDWREPANYRGKVAFSGLGLSAPSPWPTAGPLDGEVSMSEHDGSLHMRGSHFKLADAGLFEQPLQFDQFRASLDWQRAGKGWTVRLSDFAVANADMAADANATWRWAGDGPGTLSLDAHVPRLVAAKVSDYLPVSIGHETRNWLREALKAGEARDARFTLEGPLAQFPFDDGKSGTWRVVTQAKGVTLDYGANWPRIEGIDAEVAIESDKLSVKGSAGRILGTHIEHALAVIPSLGHSSGIHIDGAVNGPTAEFFRFVALSPLDKSLGGLGTAAHAAGDGHLDLKLDIPFENANETHVDGVYRFARNHVQLSDAMPEVHELNGQLHFDEHGADAKGLSGQALGGPMKADVAAHGGTVEVEASGHADARLAALRYELPFADALSGGTDYHVQVSVPASGWQIAVDAPMKDVRIDLPAPVGKPAGEARPLKLGLEADAASERWRVALGSQLGAMFYRTPQGGSWHIERGELRLGEGAPTAARGGLWLTANLQSFDADAWLARLGSGGQAGSGPGAPSIDQVAGLDVKLGQLTVAGSRVNDVTLHAYQQSEGLWQLTAASQEIEGKGSWSATPGHEKLTARLGRLMLPLADAAPAGTPAAKSSRRKLPAVDLSADDFKLNGHPLGKLEVRGQPTREGWQIDSLALGNPDGKLAMQGTWFTQGEEDRTSVKLDVDSGDIGKLLGRFGYDELLKRGKGSLHGDLGWHGSPISPEYASMSGNLKIAAEAGQFAKVNPGVGRLLGVLSLQSLPRRLSLDFRDIFSDGFAFDRIEGDSKIVRGVLSTNDLAIVGPAAQVSFKGEADIANETQKLRVRIVPTVGDSLAVGAGVALANPVVGVGAFLLQHVLKDPLGRLVAYEYDITGRWDDPQVARVSATKPGSAAGAK